MRARVGGRVRLLLLVSGATVVASAGVALATHGGDSNTLHGCVNNTNGQLRVVATPGTCRTNESSLNWARSGLSSVARVEFSSENNSQTRKGAFARCPSDMVVTGGGGQVFIETSQGGPEGTIALKASLPSSALDGWFATAEEMDPTTQSWFVSAFALCANTD